MQSSGIHVVTGATGQVGLELCRGLRGAGKPVRAVVLPHDPAIARLQANGVEVVVADVRDFAALRVAFTGADTIYHLAAMVSTSARHDPRLWQVNVEGPRNAAQAALEVGARRMLYFSSIVVFDPAPLDQPLAETRARLPVSQGSPYVRSKVVGEQVIRAAVGRGLDAVIVHPTVVIGPNETHHIGVVQSLLVAYFNRKLPATFRGGFNAVAIGDLVAGAIAAAERGRTGESYILGGAHASLTQILERSRPLCDAPVPKLSIPLGLARAGLPVVGAVARLTRSRPAFTHEDLRQLAGNTRISSQKAAQELGYRHDGLDAALRMVHAEWTIGRAATKR
ncbi:MAG: NAD-dependent epimerase/dehydratase family protein [Nannocystis sp.]|uniref:NAD-dependent epimerase/dehydratase family protein n=1 Tax=Nannocystis sp. TaxID=1962667 RepID=UPI002424F750|nr:NAD-dependent epimerase/dehydratase family protein [Nannocystis sp.]MBK9751912.1 NAD-dependent epimerase/dehydratase family protein [Nannocystis sp.]